MPVKIWLIFILFVVTHTSRAQSYTKPSRLKVSGIVVNKPDQTIKTQMLNASAGINASNDKTYMWYASQNIMETMGGFDGKLIHGYYSAFYLNNQLKEKGRVRYGLRNKQWKYWYPDGNLKEVITWKNGVKNGPYELYNDYGQLMAKGRFKNDKLHGRFYTYGNGGQVLDEKTYSEGTELISGPKTKKDPFFKRWFKKKEKAGSEQKPEEEKKKAVTS